jgi:hypothetical protein
VNSVRAEILDALERVAAALGDDLPNVVFVGAAASALFPSTSPADLRHTQDVDVLANVSRAAYYELVGRLRQRGFVECRDEGAPLCRYTLNDLVVDLMVSDPAILGFTNRWYSEAFANAGSFLLPSGGMVLAITPIYFVATKLEAFRCRGKGDFRSKDIEDIILMLDGSPGALTELRDGTARVHQAAREELTTYLVSPRFEDAVFGCFLPDPASQQRAARLLSTVEAATRGT